MWDELWSALALVLVIEGLLPALSPQAFRKAIFTVAQLDAHAIRKIGIGSMALGALLFYLVKHY